MPSLRKGYLIKLYFREYSEIDSKFTQAALLDLKNQLDNESLAKYESFIVNEYANLIANNRDYKNLIVNKSNPTLEDKYFINQLRRILRFKEAATHPETRRTAIRHQEEKKAECTSRRNFFKKAGITSAGILTSAATLSTVSFWNSNQEQQVMDRRAKALLTVFKDLVAQFNLNQDNQVERKGLEIPVVCKQVKADTIFISDKKSSIEIGIPQNIIQQLPSGMNQAQMIEKLLAIKEQQRQKAREQSSKLYQLEIHPKLLPLDDPNLNMPPLTPREIADLDRENSKTIINTAQSLVTEARENELLKPIDLEGKKFKIAIAKNRPSKLSSKPNLSSTKKVDEVNIIINANNYDIVVIIPASLFWKINEKPKGSHAIATFLSSQIQEGQLAINYLGKKLLKEKAPA